MSDPREPDDGEDVRRLLQGLPEVDPPDGFYEHLIRRKRNRARAVVVLGLVAAAVGGAIVVAQASGITGNVEPIGDVLDRHDALMAEDLADGDVRPRVGAPFQVPDHLGPFSPGMAVRHPDDVVQVVYGWDGQYFSVFEQAGDLSDDALDAHYTPLHVRGVAAWEAEDGSIVVRRSDVVYVLVGDIDTDELAQLLDELPNARPMGLGTRVKDAMDDLVNAFGLN